MRKVGYLFLILLLPSLIYITLSTGKHGVVSLPYIGEKQTYANGDSGYYSIVIPAINSVEEQLNEKLIDKILVINLVGNECMADCDRALSQIRELQSKFAEYPDIYTITLSFSDTANYTLLQSKIDDYAADSERWFLGNFRDYSHSDFVLNDLLLRDSIADVSVINQLVGKTVILDKNRHIRGYFDAKQYTQYKELVDALKVLKAEEFIRTKSGKTKV